MAKSRATQLVKQKRLEQVINLMGQGLMRFQIIGLLTDEWQMKEPGIQKYINAANKIIREGFTDEDLLAGYSLIYQSTLKENPGVALKAYDSLAKLKGRYTEKINLSGDITTKTEIRIIFPDGDAS